MFRLRKWLMKCRFLFVSKSSKTATRALFQKHQQSLTLYVDKNIDGVCLVGFNSKQVQNCNINLSISILRHSAPGHWILSDYTMFSMTLLVSMDTQYFTERIQCGGTSSIFWIFFFSCSLFLSNLAKLKPVKAIGVVDCYGLSCVSPAVLNLNWARFTLTETTWCVCRSRSE